jgi:SPX domain protein involved in polyphosphate accumulation
MEKPIKVSKKKKRMKFGFQFNLKKNKSFKDYYFNYEETEKIIMDMRKDKEEKKELDIEKENKLLETLNEGLEKINLFYVNNEKDILNEFEELKKNLENKKINKYVHQEIIIFSDGIKLLKEFVVLNMTGFKYILSKYEKVFLIL